MRCCFSLRFVWLRGYVTKYFRYYRLGNNRLLHTSKRGLHWHSSGRAPVFGSPPLYSHPDKSHCCCKAHCIIMFAQTTAWGIESNFKMKKTNRLKSKATSTSSRIHRALSVCLSGILPLSLYGHSLEAFSWPLLDLAPSLLPVDLSILWPPASQFSAPDPNVTSLMKQSLTVIPKMPFLLFPPWPLSGWLVFFRAITPKNGHCSLSVLILLVAHGRSSSLYCLSL